MSKRSFSIVDESANPWKIIILLAWPIFLEQILVSLVQAVDTAISMNNDGELGIPVPDYVEENVSTKVVKIIQSYTGIVDRMVWRKE